MTLAIAIMNQTHDTKGILELLRVNTSEETEYLVIDNGSNEPVEDLFRRYIRPKRLNYIRNEENIGLVKTMQQMYEQCETDVLAILHNDVYVYEKDWDQRVLKYFQDIPKLGAAGFFGAAGCGPLGERIQDVPIPGMMAGMSNMLEAEIHGMRLDTEWAPCAIFDGLGMIFSMEMLKAGNGFDQRYVFHHLYDRDAGLESLRRGYKNIVVNVPCHHVGGMTANRAEYQTWIDKKMNMTDYKADSFTHDENSKRFADKFKDVLPLYVEPDFSLRTGTQGQWDFKGDQILHYDLPVTEDQHD